MGRIPRIKIPGEPTVYHVMSKTALGGYPLGDDEKDHLVSLIDHFSKVYFTEILGYCIMGNHWHLAVKMHPENRYPDKEMVQRFKYFYGEEKEMAADRMSFYREKWSDLSEFIKDIKQTFSKYYNKRHGRSGFFWGDRFKSVIVEKGNTLINCLAYIDLNPVRAGLVQTPEDYRWCSLGYHVQTGNKDDFLSLDFGVTEFSKVGADKRFRLYRQFVYETGAVPKEGSAVMDEAHLAKAKQNDFKITRAMRFRYRTRYFSDSCIIGSKKFVLKIFQRFKSHFQSKANRKPNTIKGLEKIYSLKKLVE